MARLYKIHISNILHCRTHAVRPYNALLFLKQFLHQFLQAVHLGLKRVFLRLQLFCDLNEDYGFNQSLCGFTINRALLYAILSVRQVLAVYVSSLILWTASAKSGLGEFGVRHNGSRS